MREPWWLVVLVAGIGLAQWYYRAKARERSSKSPSRRPARPDATARPARVVPQQPRATQPVITQDEIREVLRRRMGAEWERQQQRVRAHVLEQERKLAAQLKNAQQTRSFEELKNLHRASRQSADQAYAMLDEVRGQVRCCPPRSVAPMRSWTLSAAAADPTKGTCGVPSTGSTRTGRPSAR